MKLRVVLLTVLAMVAFAGNSLLCRLALRDTAIDPATFTILRLLSGALALALLVRLRGALAHAAGDWISAFALFAYAAAFSFAYLSLTAGAGALLLFGAVQVTMIGYGLFTGERLRALQVAGLVCACAGLIYLLSPGLSAPPVLGALLMSVAGVAWGVYSLRGRRGGDAAHVTAGNFLRSVPFAMLLSASLLSRSRLDGAGVLYALASGAVTSGAGYALWYTVVRELKATSAATVQLSVPVLAALGGVLLLGEPLTLRLVIAALAIIGGIALVIRRGSR